MRAAGSASPFRLIDVHIRDLRLLGRDFLRLGCALCFLLVSGFEDFWRTALVPHTFGPAHLARTFENQP